MHKLLFRAYNIDGAMNVAWGTQRRERGSTGVETSSRMGVVTRNTAERMRRHGNGIIDLGRGWTMGPSKTSSVSMRSRHPRLDDISSSISDHDRFSLGAVFLFFSYDSIKLLCFTTDPALRGSIMFYIIIICF